MSREDRSKKKKTQNTHTREEKPRIFLNLRLLHIGGPSTDKTDTAQAVADAAPQPFQWGF